MAATACARLRTNLASALIIVAVAAANVTPAPLAGQLTSTTTPEVFRRFGERVVKVQVVESSSAAKSTLGSAFFVTAKGHLVTNYHVISQLVHAPNRYRVEWVDPRGIA